jgi:hypothetical protein
VSRTLINVIAGACLLLAATTVHAQAEIASFPCEGCSLVEMQEEARRAIDFGGVAIFSVSTGEIHKFVITPNTKMYEMPVDQALEDYFVALVGFWHANGRSLDMQYYVDSGSWSFERQGGLAMQARQAAPAQDPGKPLPANAYEGIQSPGKMNNVMERLDASLAAKTYVAWISFVNAVKTPILTMDGGRPVTVINFPDGSKIRATYSNDLKTWVAIPESAQDMHGNPIPLKKEDFAKDGQPTVYEFPGGIGSAAYMDFSRYAFDLGIRTSFTQGDIELVCSNTYFAEHMRWELLCSGRR